MRKLIGLYLILVMCSSCYASDTARLSIISDENGIFVYVENMSSNKINLAGNFEVGGKISLSPLSLMIIDDLNNEYRVRGVIDGKSRSIVDIPGWHFYGRKFSFEELKFYFDIKPGTYNIKAVYHDKLASKDKENKLINSLESEWTKIKIE